MTWGGVPPFWGGGGDEGGARLVRHYYISLGAIPEGLQSPRLSKYRTLLQKGVLGGIERLVTFSKYPVVHT